MAFDDGVKTVSGSVAHTDDAATKVPFVSVKCGIEPTLSGVSSVTVTQTGGNLFDIFTATNGQINGTNGVYYANANWQASDFFPVHGANLTLSWDTDSSNYYQVNIAFYDSAEHYIDGSNNTYANIYSKTFTIPSGAVYCRASWSISVGGSPAPRNNIRINLGSADSGYTPYIAPTTYTADLGRTIYGGTADIVNGVGKETYSTKIIFDGSNDEVWQKHGSIASWFFIDHFFNNAYADNAKDDFILSSWGTQRKYNNVGGLSNGDFSYGENERFVIKNTDFTEVADFKEWLSNNPISIVYKLATPTDFTFTPITPTPETVGNVNNVYCNTGDTEVTYYDNAHGFAEVTVNKTGKNFLDDTLSNLEQGSINGSTGNNENANNRVRSIHAIPFPYDEIVSSYTWTIPNGYKVAIRPYDANGNFVQLPSWALAFITQLPQNLIGQGIVQMRFVLAKTDNSAITPSEMANIGFQIELGSQASSYEPYEAVSKTAYLHKVIYGGTADVIRGTCEPKNLMKYPYVAESGSTSKNIEFTFDDKGIIHLEGEHSTTGNAVFYLDNNVNLKNLASGKYVFSQDGFNFTASNDTVQLTVVNKSDDSVSKRIQLNGNTTSKSFVVDDDEYIHDVFIRISPHSVNIDVNVMLESGETETTFVPYFDPFTFTPISMETDEGDNTLFANEGASAITYRKETE